MIKKIVAISACTLAFAALAGCATPKAWSAIGGSRADATVTLAYEYGLFEQPQISDSGDAVALQRCRAWGYSGAEAFGAPMSRCVAMTNSGCQQTQVTKTYQCLGTGSPGASAYIHMSPKMG
ncbi:YecR family lipoprotein [[Roseibacterium] beibuensis]|uniref:YecR family lipoprotein n=1 Tax=[Roseibacterium] beibuensis TaxID=1193142 RepID=UPI00386DA7D5